MLTSADGRGKEKENPRFQRLSASHLLLKQNPPRMINFGVSFVCLGQGLVFLEPHEGQILFAVFECVNIYVFRERQTGLVEQL